VTLVSAEAWRDVCAELRADVPWHKRRANLLVEGLDLSKTLGQTLAVGTVRLKIHGESKPCGIMDEMHAGLRKALVPDGRGGVYAQVLQGGVIHVGDSIHIEAE
jgi:MOSC domain-containing protein YiiM